MYNKTFMHSSRIHIFIDVYWQLIATLIHAEFRDKHLYRHLDVYNNMHLFLNKEVKFQPKTPLRPRPGKGCNQKDVKSRGGSQVLCRNAVDHIKKIDNDSGHKTLRQKMFCSLGHHYQNF